MIYLDGSGGRKINEDTIDLISNAMRDWWYNPSANYQEGRAVKAKIKHCRELIAESLNCDPEEIFFTSGATESNNTIIKTFSNRNDYIITSLVEHKSVIVPVMKAECEPLFLTVDEEGNINEGIFYEAAKNASFYNKTLISLMLVNNVIGNISPIERYVKQCKKIAKEKKTKIYFHSDLSQAIGIIKIDLKKLGVDYATISGQKFGTPKGIGILYIKRGSPLTPLMYGGGQENGIRSGTENYPYILALASCLCTAQSERTIEFNNAHYDLLQKAFFNGIKDIDVSYRINGDMLNRAKYNINISFENIASETLQILLDEKGYKVSVGSVCNSNNNEPDYVLKAMNVPEEYLRSSIRITFSPENTLEEVEKFTEELKNCLSFIKKNLSKRKEIEE